jgi:hypothetical protein
MHTIETRYPDGTRARYTLAPGSTVPLHLAALKPPRPPRSKADKRLFPKWSSAMSTADYVRHYYGLNTGHSKQINAYDNYEDHLALYHPLPDTPAATYTGVDSFEIVEVDE